MERLEVLSQDYTTKDTLYGKVSIASMKELIGRKAIYTRVQHFALENWIPIKMHQIPQFFHIFTFICGGVGYYLYTNGHTHICACVCCCRHIWRSEVEFLLSFCLLSFVTGSHCEPVASPLAYTDNQQFLRILVPPGPPHC